MHRLFVVLAVSSCLAAQAEAGGFRRAPVPGWVQRQSLLGLEGGAASRQGPRLLLVDRQVRVAAHTVEHYMRWTRRVSDESDLQTATQVNVELDPSYETVLLHGVSVIRDGQRLDRLHPAAIKQVQRERNLEAQIFDGRQSLVLFIEDLRVGDLIDVEYTIVGADPTLAGHVSESLPFGAFAPTAYLHVRVLTPPGRAVHTRASGPQTQALEPKVSHTAAGDEYVWERTGAPAYLAEAGTPSWFTAMPTLEISDFGSWAEVASWGRLLTHVPTSPSRALSGQASALRREARTDLGFVRAATRFVQDQIRYVALETGLSRRRSTDPDTVLTRRFGDCKDKSVLLTSLLRSGGVDAAPALVSTTFGAHLDEHLPGAGQFDHMIVRVGPIDGGYLWIDPTATLQGGQLVRARFSPFGRALVLSPGSDELVTLSAELPATPFVDITERYELPEPGSLETARLDVVRTFYGARADAMRVTLGATQRERTAKNYLQMYARQFPGIESRAPLEVHDEREDDLLRIEAHFTIRDPWKWVETARRWNLEVQPTLLGAYLEKPEVTGRSVPLATPHPESIHCAVELVMPHEWPLTPERLTADSPAFEFEFASHRSERIIRYDYTYKGLADHVEPAQLAAHAVAVAKAGSYLSRMVIWRSLQTGANPWAWWGLLLTLLLCAVLTPRLYRYSPPSQVPSDLPLAPFTGWLVLLGLRLFVYPISFLVPLIKARWFFNRAAWQGLVDPLVASPRPLLPYLILVEQIALTMLTWYTSILLVTYLKRRTSFPFHFTVATIATVVYGMVDRAAAEALGLSGAGMTTQTLVIQLVIGGLLIRYVLLSPQVKRTFTRPYRA